MVLNHAFAEFDQKEPLKRGRGSQRKTKVLVMTESEIVENLKKGKKPKRVGYLKMKVIENLKKETINKGVKELAHEVSEIDTDDSTSYVDLKTMCQSITSHNP